ncbi:hypothetical protein NQ317_003940 [Molorchus minor]|uniref:Uncharacterized protein n=1 Tax=Molorchus minor TaxID=1323400 RepID=A0ABQ9IQ79_9CUCU|nr:hypothetical protein NQ317_003940 [Molorchus minor]
MSDNDKATRDDKYSLRPRSMRRRNNINEDSSKMCYLHRANQESKNETESGAFSKYRRKTATQRGRSRNEEINQAFETLKKWYRKYPPRNTRTKN